MPILENKRIFLFATGDEKINGRLEVLIEAYFHNSTIFKAVDGIDAQFKIENVIPHVVIISYDIPRLNAVGLTTKLINKKERVAVIILAHSDISQDFVDEIVTGQVQFLTSIENEKKFISHVNRALNWVSNQEESLYHIRFVGEGETLIKNGESGNCVYIVRSGRLKASKLVNGKEVVLGYVEPGEFVGEMAYINGEARSADVVSLEETELIEIPADALDAILYSKPAWSKGLMRTLSRRLKSSNLKQTPDEVE